MRQGSISPSPTNILAQAYVIISAVPAGKARHISVSLHADAKGLQAALGDGGEIPAPVIRTFSNHLIQFEFIRMNACAGDSFSAGHRAPA